MKRKNKSSGPRNAAAQRRIEDAYDWKMLKAMRARPLRFRKLEEFLKHSSKVT